MSCVSLVPVKGGGDCHPALPTAVTSSQNTLCAGVTEFSLHFSQFCPLFPGVRHLSAVVRSGTAGVYFGVSFKDSSLSVRPSFLCHTGAFFCFLPHCLLTHLNVGSNLSYLPSVSTESVRRSLLCLTGNHLFFPRAPLSLLLLFTCYSIYCGFYSISSRLCVVTPPAHLSKSSPSFFLHPLSLSPSSQHTLSLFHILCPFGVCALKCGSAASCCA